MAKFEYNAYKGAPLSADQTEKVLTAHGLGMLKTVGRAWYPHVLESCDTAKGCINQIVYNVPMAGEAFDKNKAIACWFDHRYDPQWTVDEFLEAMRSAQVTEA